MNLHRSFCESRTACLEHHEMQTLPKAHKERRRNATSMTNSPTTIQRAQRFFFSFFAATSSLFPSQSHSPVPAKTPSINAQVGLAKSPQRATRSRRTDGPRDSHRKTRNRNQERQPPRTSSSDRSWYHQSPIAPADTLYRWQSARQILEQPCGVHSRSETQLVPLETLIKPPRA